MRRMAEAICSRVLGPVCRERQKTRLSTAAWSISGGAKAQIICMTRSGVTLRRGDFVLWDYFAIVEL